jgi:hypothetical protein
MMYHRKKGVNRSTVARGVARGKPVTRTCDGVRLTMPYYHQLHARRRHQAFNDVIQERRL